MYTIIKEMEKIGMHGSDLGSGQVKGRKICRARAVPQCGVGLLCWEDPAFLRAPGWDSSMNVVNITKIT
jgi:hypothetical protein